MANLRIPARLFWPHREEKSLTHVTKVAKFLDDSNGENVTSDCFKIHRSYSISFNLSNVGSIFWVCIWKYLSLEKEKRKLLCCVHLHHKTARKIRKFHEAVVQRRLRIVQKSVRHVQSCCFAKINLLLFCCFLCCRCLLLWSRNFATMVTWRHTSPLYSSIDERGETAVFAGYAWADLGGECRGCAPPPLRWPAVF